MVIVTMIDNVMSAKTVRPTIFLKLGLLHVLLDLGAVCPLTMPATIPPNKLTNANHAIVKQLTLRVNFDFVKKSVKKY